MAIATSAATLLIVPQLDQVEKASVSQSTKTTSTEGSSERPATGQATPSATHLRHQSPDSRKDQLILPRSPAVVPFRRALHRSGRPVVQRHLPVTFRF
jgi:hypothetical protein